MRRSAFLVLGLTAGAVVFSACRDTAVAPEQGTSPVELNVPSVSFDELQGSSSGVSFTVTIDPTRENVYSDGINTIVFPAGSICDPATSGYGPGTWDLPCASATSPITLPVNISLRGARLHIEFGKDLRFSPSKQVVLTMNNPALTTTSEDLRRFAIFYVPTGGTKLVDEGATDPSLVTIVKRDSGQLVRRLKHFTGYNVHLGMWDDCEPGVDDGCYEQPPTGTVQAQ